MTENDLEQLKIYGAQFAGDTSPAEDETLFSDIHPVIALMKDVHRHQLAAAQARIAELERELYSEQQYREEIADAMTREQQQNARLVAALTPFAEAAEDYHVKSDSEHISEQLYTYDTLWECEQGIWYNGDNTPLTRAHLRAAAEALKADDHE